MRYGFVNNFAQTLAAPLGEGASTLTLDGGGSQLSAASADLVFTLTLFQVDDQGEETAREIVMVTGASGNDLTIVGAQEGTARPIGGWPTGTEVEARLTALGLATLDYRAAEVIMLGTQATASGDSSIALGPWSTASGNWSVAIGGYSSAGGKDSVALGYANVAEGASAAVAVGEGAICDAPSTCAIGHGAGATANATQGVAIGRHANVSGAVGIALGSGSNVFGQGGVAIGSGAQAAELSSSFGSGADASSPQSSAFGADASAQPPQCSVFGADSFAANVGQTLLGYGAGGSGVAGGLVVHGLAHLVNTPIHPPDAMAPPITRQAAAQVVIATEPLNLTDDTAAVELALPPGAMLFIDSFDVVVVGSDDAGGSPEISIGPDDLTPADYLASTPVSLTAVGGRDSHTPLIDDGVVSLRVATTVAGTGTTYQAKVVVRGYVMEL